MLAIAMAVFAQAGDIDRLIEALRSEAVEDRERAEKNLLEAGESALPALKKALATADAEASLRLAAVIEELERPARERAIDTANRPAALRLVDLDVREARLDRALDKLATMCGFAVDLPTLDAGRLCNLTARAMPLSECLDRLLDPLELHWTLEDGKVRVRPGREPRAIARTAGGRFGFRAREHLGGTTVETTVTPDVNGVIDFDIVRLAGIADDVVVERCSRCSPRLIHVRSLDGLKPVLSVTRTWLSRHDVVFDNPSDGQKRKVGDFTIEVAWPQLRVTSARDVPSDLLPRLCDTFTYELKPDAEAIDRYGGRLGGRRNLVARGGGGEKTWCDCPGGPQKGDRPAPAVARERTVSSNANAAAFRISDVKRITLSFHKPVVEREELTGPELKIGR